MIERALWTGFRQPVFPEPAPYVYYVVTAVRPGSFDLISDDGEPWQGIPVDREDLAKIEVGGRFLGWLQPGELRAV